MRAVAALVVTLVSSVALAQSPDPKVLLEKAIAFHGGKDALASLPDVKQTGTIETAGRSAGRARDFAAYERGDGGRRTEVTFDFRGRQVTAIEIYDGKMCKQRFGSGWDELPLDENRERAAHRIDLLLRALDRAPSLAGDGIEAGVPVWQVSIDDGPRGKATLSLAKDDGRLVAIEYPGTEAEGMGTKKEVRRKVVHHGFQQVGALKLPSDIEMVKDGTFDGRLRFERIEAIADWDDGWLQVPDPRRRFIPSDELAF
ncbi:MAG TPA: hypothetical protein VFV75_03960 [Candidatus Polarisedimenticolaceae bacterium]|nr:hypothetical protein [Candidatus Polarisedimenticolaceae bacterium]